MTGNAGTTPGTDFLGTTDKQALVLKTNGTEALRVDTSGNIGIGTGSPGARLEAVANSSTPIALLGTSPVGGTPGVVGRLGSVACTGAYVVGCAGATSGVGVLGLDTGPGTGVEGASNSGFGVLGSSNGGFGVRGQSNTSTGVDASSDSGVGAHGDSATGDGVYGTSGTGIGLHGHGGSIGMLATSDARAVVGSVGGGACPAPVPSGVAPYGVGGCGGSTGFGVVGNSSVQSAVVGYLGESLCTQLNAVSACGNALGNGLYAQTSDGISGSAIIARNDSSPTGCCDLFLGLSNGVREARIGGDGTGYFNGGAKTGGADYAESMPSDSATMLQPGDVLAIDPRHPNEVRKSWEASSSLVAGVYSTRPSVLAIGNHRITDSRRGEVPVAMLGIVPTKVTAQNGSIRVGDLLTTSSTPGYAMKAPMVLIGGVPTYRTGTILGKALEPLGSGKGVIKVMVTLR